jgi:hypothetical protein
VTIGGVLAEGSSEFDQAQVAQWVEFGWYELDVPLCAMLLPSADAKFDPETIAQVVQNDLMKVRPRARRGGCRWWWSVARGCRA